MRELNEGAREQIERAFERAADGDFGAFVALLADDCRWTLSGTTRWSRTYAPKSAIVEELLRPVRARIEGPMRIAAHRIVGERDVVVVEARGDNVTRDGERYDNAYCFVFRTEGERIVEVTEYADTALVTKMLGGA